MAIVDSGNRALVMHGASRETLTGDRRLTSAGVQLVLPSLATVMLPYPVFAHPFERDFARQLDAFRVAWRYEPTTFVLSRRLDGAPRVCFTPDFYLPGLGIYVELTTVRQALVTRKHRKLRQFRTVYPHVPIVMLYRRDYQRLLSDWSSAVPALAAGEPITLPDPPRAYIDTGTLARRLDALAGQLADRYAALGERPLLVAAGQGAGLFAQDLSNRLGGLGMPADVEMVGIVQSQRGVRVQHDDGAVFAGRTATLVATMVSTGLTSFYLHRWLRHRGARLVELCALLDRRSARVAALPITYTGFEAPPAMVVGYGLCLDRAWRDLPFVGFAGQVQDARIKQH